MWQFAIKTITGTEQNRSLLERKITRGIFNCAKFGTVQSHRSLVRVTKTFTLVPGLQKLLTGVCLSLSRQHMVKTLLYQVKGLFKFHWERYPLSTLKIKWTLLMVAWLDCLINSDKSLINCAKFTQSVFADFSNDSVPEINISDFVVQAAHQLHDLVDRYSVQNAFLQECGGCVDEMITTEICCCPQIEAIFLNLSFFLSQVWVARKTLQHRRGFWNSVDWPWCLLHI